VASQRLHQPDHVNGDDEGREQDDRDAEDSARATRWSHARILPGFGRILRALVSAFDPLFFQNHPLFWPLTRAASTFAAETDWPEVTSYARAFAGQPVVRFERAKPSPRRRRGPVDARALYDARITRDACVPTRARSWHDFLNALVWCTFPRAKRAVHRRQLRALLSRLAPEARTLPSARSREHDALALLDEGGLVVLDDGRTRVPVVFGHALYEGLVRGRSPLVGAAVESRVAEVPHDRSELVSLADEVLEARLADRVLLPEQLIRVPVIAPRGE